VEFSVKHDHLILIVEATAVTRSRAGSSAMKGPSFIRLAGFAVEVPTGFRAR
jgi:hypothetical protein